MSPQFSENLLTEIYVEPDDLLKAFKSWCEQKALGEGVHPTRTPEVRPQKL